MWVGRGLLGSAADSVLEASVTASESSSRTCLRSGHSRLSIARELSHSRSTCDLWTHTTSTATNLFLCDSARRKVVDAVLEAVLGHLIVGRNEIFKLHEARGRNSYIHASTRIIRYLHLRLAQDNTSSFLKRTWLTSSCALCSGDKFSMSLLFTHVTCHEADLWTSYDPLKEECPVASSFSTAL